MATDECDVLVCVERPGCAGRVWCLGCLAFGTLWGATPAPLGRHPFSSRALAFKTNNSNKTKYNKSSNTYA